MIHANAAKKLHCDVRTCIPAGSDLLDGWRVRVAKTSINKITTMLIKSLAPSNTKQMIV